MANNSEVKSQKMLLLCLLFGIAFATDNGLGRVPQMGYNTWNDFRCNVKASDVIGVAEHFASLNLATVRPILIEILKPLVWLSIHQFG